MKDVLYVFRIKVKLIADKFLASKPEGFIHRCTQMNADALAL